MTEYGESFKGPEEEITESSIARLIEHELEFSRELREYHFTEEVDEAG